MLNYVQYQVQQNDNFQLIITKIVSCIVILPVQKFLFALHATLWHKEENLWGFRVANHLMGFPCNKINININISFRVMPCNFRQTMCEESPQNDNRRLVFVVSFHGLVKVGAGSKRISLFSPLGCIVGLNKGINSREFSKFPMV